MDFARFALPLALALLTGCVGNEGDQCQEEDDCNDGLMCCKLGGGGLAGRGTCEPATECVATGRDAGPGVDAGPEGDAGGDGGTECDPALVQVIDGGMGPVTIVLDGGSVVANCPTGFYCSVPTCMGTGFCAVVPDECSGVFEPVCACASLYENQSPSEPMQSFQNACEAARASRSVASTGECGASPLDAGTDAGTPMDDAGTDAGATADGGPDGG